MDGGYSSVKHVKEIYVATDQRPGLARSGGTVLYQLHTVWLLNQPIYYYGRSTVGFRRMAELTSAIQTHLLL